MNLTKLVLALGLASIVFGCGKKAEFGVTGDPSKRPSEKIEDSFKIVHPIQPGPQKKQIAIKKEALGLEFLLSTQVVNVSEAPKFRGAKSRIVSFVLGDDQVFLFEAQDGNVVTDQFPSKFLIARFPLVMETEDAVVFDFDRGMSQLYNVPEWRAIDLEPRRNNNMEFATLDVSLSYIDDAYVTQEKLVVRQVAQIQQVVDRGVKSNMQVETLYYISPYRPDETYKPKATPDFDRLGYFNQAPRHSNSGLQTFATRFGEGPIVFAISADTPAEYVEAVREGILYWNKAFGEERVQAVMAPKGVSAPNPNYNVVQWVTWDSAGSAYADAQVNPRTGQILHAQVFMTSVFAVGNKNRARAFLRKANQEHTHSHSVDLRGFESSELCDFDALEVSKKFAEAILESNADDETILRASIDAVRLIVAHEIGHTLGVRHNFAGNLAANFSARDLADIFQRYLRNEDISDVVPTSSVMDYLHFESLVMAGALAKDSDKAFAYDEKVIQSLYYDKVFSKEELPLFCTDSHSGKYLGCTVWDHGNSPIDHLVTKANEASGEWANRLMEGYIRALTLDREQATQPKALSLSPKSDLGLALGHRSETLKLLGKSLNDLRVHRRYDKVDATNEKRVQEAQLELWRKELAQAGGLSALLSRPGESLVENLKNEVSKTLSSPTYLQGIGYDGQPYALTARQVKEISESLDLYYEALLSLVPEVDVETLKPSNGPLIDDPLSADLADIYLARALEYLVTESGQYLQDTITVGEEKTVRVSLPVFKYPFEVRQNATKLLLETKAEGQDWNFDQAIQLKNVFQDKLKTALLDNSIDAVTLKGIQSPTRRWIMENRTLWGPLKGK